MARVFYQIGGLSVKKEINFWLKLKRKNRKNSNGAKTKREKNKRNEICSKIYNWREVQVDWQRFVFIAYIPFPNKKNTKCDKKNKFNPVASLKIFKVTSKHTEKKNQIYFHSFPFFYLNFFLTFSFFDPFFKYQTDKKKIIQDTLTRTFYFLLWI